MKNSYVAILVLGAVGVTAGIQEWRMAGFERSLEQVEASAAPAREMPSRSNLNFPGEPPRRSNVDRADEDRPADEESEGFSKSIRKMWDNPAAKSMMSQGVKIAVAMMYEDYIETLGLTDDEKKHFRDLLGSEMASQQEIGMKMMGASAEERKELVKEIAERKKESEEDIKTFLNNDEDFEAYQSYKERLPERQQLEAVRASMAAKDAVMDGATESKLIEAMHKARTQPGLADFSGEGAYEEMGKDDLEANFEENWQAQQTMLRGEVGFLSETQKEAFFEHQEQMKEFQMMGLKMAGQMMKGEE